MQVRRPLAAILVLFSFSLLCAPVFGQTRRLPVKLVADVNYLDDTERAMFSSDGKVAATLDRTTGIKLWEISSGRLLRTLRYQAFFTAAAFSPDGKWIVSGHKDGKIKLWEVATGALAATWQPRPKAEPDDYLNEISALWIDAKGTVLISGDHQGLITVWDIANRKQLRSFEFGKTPGVNSQIHGLRLTSDQTGIIAISEVTAKIFDFKTGKIVTAFDLPNAYPIWNNNDQTIFADDSIIGDDSLIARFSGPSCEIDELRLFSLKDPKDFVTVDKPDKCKKPKEGDSFGDAKIFTSPGGPGIVITRYGMPEVKQWDPTTRSVTRTIQWSVGGDDIIGLDSGFKLAVSRRAENIRISQLADGALVREFKGTAYPAETSFVSRDDHIMLLSHAPAAADRNDKDVTVWPLGTLTPASTHFAADKETYIRDFAPAAKLALAVTEKGDMIVLSAETGKELRRFSVPYIESFARARLSPDGKLIAVVGTDANDKAVAALLDAGSGAVIHRFAGHDERNGMMASSGSGDESDLVSTVTFSSDSKRLALGRWNGTAEIWDTQKVQRVKTLPAAEGDDADQIWSLAFSADGSKLIAGSRDAGAFLWDIASARAPRTFVYESLAGHVHIASVALSHDGALVAGGLALHAVSSGDIGTEHSIKVWNAATGKLRFTLRGHEGGVEAVVFSPDDRWIISTGNDGTVRYWNSSNGQWAATFTATRDGRWIIFTESGIFAGTADGDDFIDVVRGVESLPASKFRDQLFRPELVEALLNGDRDHRYQDAAKKLDLEKVWGANMTR